MNIHPLPQVDVDPYYKDMWYDMRDRLAQELADRYGYADLDFAGHLTNIALENRFPSRWENDSLYSDEN